MLFRIARFPYTPNVYNDTAYIILAIQMVALHTNLPDIESLGEKKKKKTVKNFAKGIQTMNWYAHNDLIYNR